MNISLNIQGGPLELAGVLTAIGSMESHEPEQQVQIALPAPEAKAKQVKTTKKAEIEKPEPVEVAQPEPVEVNQPVGVSEPQSAEVSQPQPVEVSQPTEVAETTSTAPRVKLEDVRALAISYLQTDRAGVANLLQSFGVQKIQELGPADYQPFMDGLKAL